MDGLLTVYGPRPEHRAPACPGHLPTPCTRKSTLSCTPAASPGQAAQCTVHLLHPQTSTSSQPRQRGPPGRPTHHGPRQRCQLNRQQSHASLTSRCRGGRHPLSLCQQCGAFWRLVRSRKFTAGAAQSLDPIDSGPLPPETCALSDVERCCPGPLEGGHTWEPERVMRGVQDFLAAKGLTSLPAGNDCVVNVSDRDSVARRRQS
jgi:hypothetical protein